MAETLLLEIVTPTGVALHEQVPHYGFAGHKGYGTAAHFAALREHGPSIHHRRSFLAKSGLV